MKSEQYQYLEHVLICMREGGNFPNTDVASRLIRMEPSELTRAADAFLQAEEKFMEALQKEVDELITDGV